MSRSPFDSLKKLKQRLQRKLDQTFETATQSVLSHGSTVVINGVQVSGGNEDFIQGSGVFASEKRQVAPFRKISNSLMATVSVKVNPALQPQEPKREDLGGDPFRRSPDEVPTPYLVEIEGDDNLIPMVETIVRDGRLELRMRGSFQNHRLLKVSAVTKELVSLEHDGHGTMEVTDVVGEALSIRHTGMGDLYVAGTADEVEAALSGYGDVRIGPLKEARILDLTHSGMGNVTITGSVAGFHARLSGHGDTRCERLTASSANVHISGMGNATLHAKTVHGRHSGRGDVVVTGCDDHMSYLRSTGLGDVRYR